MEQILIYLDKFAPFMQYKFYIIGALLVLILLMAAFRRKSKTVHARIDGPALSAGSMQPKPLPGRAFAKVLTEERPLERLSVYSVNNDAPFFFTDNGKTGFYIPSGDVEIKAEYFWHRRAVLYTTEVSGSGVKRIQLKPEEGRIYRLSFDTEKEVFTVKE